MRDSFGTYGGGIFNGNGNIEHIFAADCLKTEKKGNGKKDMFEDYYSERYALAYERMKTIALENELKEENFRRYFVTMAEFVLKMAELAEGVQSGEYQDAPLEKLEALNRSLYADVAGGCYETSYANPAYACKRLGEAYGRQLSFLYMELRGMIVLAYEQRLEEFTILMELLIEIYCMFEEEIPTPKAVSEVLYWYVSDYSDEFVTRRISEQLDINYNFAVHRIMNEDLSDIRYLYSFGEYITQNEIRTAQYLNSLPKERIEAMARTFTQGYRKGFELGNKDMGKKKLVNIRYALGFERLVREEIRQFQEMGLETVIYRTAIHSIDKRMHLKTGYHSTSPNKQMDYDHRFDSALYLDSDFVERKLGALRLAYEKNKVLASVFGGPAVMEVFGEEPFEPVDKPECFHLDARQQKLSVKYDNEASAIVNRYIKGEERSFTIIAYPLPEIGSDYEKIFDETVTINTLDYELYQGIQQRIVDALDGADYVEIKGKNGNLTDLRVHLLQIDNPKEQTIFENCLADVNIPLGEVFTSPVLSGTEGLLHVSSVYLNALKFNNLRVWFRDGMVTDYACDNFADAQKGKEFFKENVLYNHDSLPIGEFAIGTNTAAYVMANRYDIVYKLPILIVEKMGPHFAVGDTCYSRSEDVKVYNPDGKEIISRDNEISLRRKTEPEKAYYNCHTDITIPYDEIGRITAVNKDGTSVDIIEDGRFVLEGCDLLNEPFCSKC